MPKIILIRHPETIWNVEKRFQGQKEGLITEEGKQLSQQVIEEVSNQTINVIFYANNMRTKFVADLLSQAHPEAKIIMDERLNERFMGEYEGLFEKELNKSTRFNPKNYKARYFWKPPSGESHFQLAQRLIEFLGMLEEKFLDQDNVVCVTSSGVIKNILRIEHHLTLEQMYNLKIDNLEITYLRHEIPRRQGQKRRTP